MEGSHGRNGLRLAVSQKMSSMHGAVFPEKKKVQIIYPIPSMDGIFTYMDG